MRGPRPKTAVARSGWSGGPWVTGGTEAAGFLHLARTVCRRAERRAVALAADEPVPAGAIVYLNRLSDMLFTAARAANAAAEVPDTPWTGEGT